MFAQHNPTANLWGLTITVVGACLVLGGAQVLAGLSGVNVYAACFIVRPPHTMGFWLHANILGPARSHWPSRSMSFKEACGAPLLRTTSTP